MCSGSGMLGEGAGEQGRSEKGALALRQEKKASVCVL